MKIYTQKGATELNYARFARCGAHGRRAVVEGGRLGCDVDGHWGALHAVAYV